MRGRPSSLLSTLGQTAAAVADLRQVARLLPQGHPHRREAERRLAYLVP